MPDKPVLAVIGGSGLYDMPGLTETQNHQVNTPFGRPSAPIISGILEGKPVLFLARHGIGHRINPTKVNYRANIYALKSLGAKCVVSVSACGSLRADYAPGNIVVPDQLFDFTRGRERSFFDEDLVVHVSTADPFCAHLSSLLAASLDEAGAATHRGGTMITIEGPRFSTRAESNLYRAWGMSLIGMTTSPEAFLAREAEMCYSVMAHVTDYDVWHMSEESVSVDMVIRTLNENTRVAQDAIKRLVVQLSDQENCTCNDALKDALITQPGHISSETRQKLDLLVGRYLK